MEKKIRVGIIGTGFGAKVHAPMMMHHSGYEVKAIASVSRGKLQEIKEGTGIKNVYDNWEKMIEEEDLDLVTITSAPFLHKEMVLKAFQNKLDVLAEKPMAMNVNEAIQMITARDEHKVKAFINFEFRNLPARLKVKEILDSGKLGRILHINYRGIYQGYSRAFKRKYWLGDKEKGGGMLGALGSHMIDSLQWWKNKKIASVYGQLPIHFPKYVDENGVKEIRTAEDTFQVIGDFEDGTTFSMDFILSNRNKTGWGLEIHGTNGSLTMIDDKRVELALGDEVLTSIDIPSELQAEGQMTDYAKKYYAAFIPQLDHLQHAITGGKPSPTLATFEDGYHVQMVMDAIRKSAYLEKKISI